MYKKITLIFLGVLVIVGVYHMLKPLPEHVNYAGEVHTVPVSSVQFFSDVTYVNDQGDRISEQEIFDELYRMIDEANHYILVDMFFFSDFIGVETHAYRYLAEELTQKLIDKKQSDPNVAIQVITDPINVMYGGHVSTYFEALRAAGIPVIVSELRPLRDSNPIYSALWRALFQWFGNSDTEGWLPNPLDAKSPKLGVRTYLKMFNYKANHRKVAVTDFTKAGQAGYATLITSANPHDGSSAHSNSAIRIDAKIWRDVAATEAAVAAFSREPFYAPAMFVEGAGYEYGEETVAVQLLTERAIKEAVLREIGELEAGERLDMAMFYIADRDVVRALKAADSRGAELRLLFDPNKDAFGREKNGIPNRQVAHELMSHTEGNTIVRWCNTHGEQCHSKLLVFHTADGVRLLLGSANLTRRNLDNYNLETNVLIGGLGSEEVFVEAQTFFDSQWDNEGGIEYSLPYEAYEDTSFWRTLVYRFKEFTGLSRW